jgi:hypothetical protein
MTYREEINVREQCPRKPMPLRYHGRKQPKLAQLQRQTLLGRSPERDLTTSEVSFSSFYNQGAIDRS